MSAIVKTLDLAKVGSLCKIKRINASDVKAQTIRFGLTEGKEVWCQTVIPAGPIVLKINQQEIALGRNLARRIEVEEISNVKLS